MKKWMSMMLTIALNSAALLAQTEAKKGPCKKLETIEQWMKDSLSLQADQVVKIEALHKETCTKFETARQEASGNKELLKEKNKGIMEELRIGYKGILSEEQLGKLKRHRKEKKDTAARHGKVRMSAEARADSLTNTFTQELSLTASQILLVKAANLNLMKHRDELRELKRNGTDSLALRENHREFMKEYKRSMQDILTDSQEEKLKEWHKAHKGKKGSEAKPDEE
jgi:hypothetical protein